MTGFVNFAADIAYAIAVALPTLCYLLGGLFLLGSFWGFWRLSMGNGLRERRPWVPFTTLLVAGTLLSFDRMVTFANATFGEPTTVSIEALTSYTPPAMPTGSLLGATPQDTLLNVIDAFDAFFKAYGALVIFLSVLALKGIAEGNRRASTSSALVQMVFGVAVMNAPAVAGVIMGYFS